MASENKNGQTTKKQTEQEVPDEWKKYDYIKCTVTDLYSVSRGKIMTAAGLKSFYNKGTGMPLGKLGPITMKHQ